MSQKVIIFIVLLIVLNLKSIYAFDSSMVVEQTSKSPSLDDPGSLQIEIARLPGDVFQDELKDGSKGPSMVVIAAGSFRMGDIQGGGAADEKPVHTVHIQSFAMGQYEVTFDEYTLCVSANRCNKADDKDWGEGRRPVINVSWKDAQDYVAWLSNQTGREYRLPSETEWEYAARAGTETEYWWGHDVGDNNTNCWGCEQFDRKTAVVGTFKANPFGLYDTSGNVWEWVADCWHKNYVGAILDGSMWTGGNCSRRVIRGGGRGNKPDRLRSAYRSSEYFDGSLTVLGFRLARDL